MTDPRAQYRANHDKAKAAGEKTYHGTLCKKHNSTLRYISNYACIECRKFHNRRVYLEGPRNEGNAVYDKQYKPVALKPWPASQFEDAATYDHVGTYRPPYITNLRYASSAADMAEW